MKPEARAKDASDPTSLALQASGFRPLPFPNGSVANLAGQSVLAAECIGLMPHPERFLFATQHPHWTRLGLRGEGAGMRLFRNAFEYFG